MHNTSSSSYQSICLIKVNVKNNNNSNNNNNNNNNESEEQTNTLVKIVYVFSTDIGMEFGINKCGILTMKRGRTVIKKG